MRVVLTLVLVALTGTGVVLIRRDLPAWRSDPAFWTATVRETPGNVPALINLAVDAIEREQYAQAAQLLDQADAVPIKPLHAADYIRANRASLLLREGDWVTARAILDASPERSLARQLCRQYAGLCWSQP